MNNQATILTYKLISTDNHVFKISTQPLAQMKVISQMMSALNYTQEELDEQQPTPVATNGATLRKIIEWVIHHQMDPVPDSVNIMNGARVPPWDRAFLKRVDETCGLESLVCAANFLDIPNLLDYTCTVIAGKAMGKCPAEIAKLFAITTDQEDEEAEQAVDQMGGTSN